jgi:hypothetical protein
LKIVRWATLGVQAWPAFNVETFRCVEIKHAVGLKSFRAMQSFHVVAARGAAAPRWPGARVEDRAAVSELTALRPVRAGFACNASGLFMPGHAIAAAGSA